LAGTLLVRASLILGAPLAGISHLVIGALASVSLFGFSRLEMVAFLWDILHINAYT